MPKGFYDRFAWHLAGLGAVVLTYDFRGIAGSRPEDLAAMQMDYPDWGRLDMPAALEALILALEDETEQAPDGSYPLRRNVARIETVLKELVHARGSAAR